MCSNILARNLKLGYCIKQISLSSRVQISNIVYSPELSVFYSLYTTNANDIKLNFTYSVKNVPSFALFGLTPNILIQNSIICVHVPEQLVNSALVCLVCDLGALSVDFIFQALGQNVSGLILSPLTNLNINQSHIQNRMYGHNIGLVQIFHNITVTLDQCNISVFIAPNSIYSSLFVQILDNVVLLVNYVKLCSNVPIFGQGTVTNQIGDFEKTCILCRDQIYAYGLCQSNLQFADLINDTLICKNPFEFDGIRCLCPENYILNETSCVNILKSVNQLINLQLKTDDQLNNIINTFDDTKSQLDMSIMTLNAFVSNQQNDIQELNKQLSNNISILETEIINLNISLSTCISQNTKDIQQVNNSLISFNAATSGNITIINVAISNLNTVSSNQQKQITTNLNSLIAINTSYNAFVSTVTTNNSNQNTAINNLNSQIASQKSQIQALQALKYQQTLPIGTILMFDAAGWIDNSTMMGWYACTAVNHNSNNNIPSLESQFIRGISPSARQSSVLQSGTGFVNISLSNLPPHRHNINHKHDVIVNGQDPGVAGTEQSTTVLIQTGQSKMHTFSRGNNVLGNSYTITQDVTASGDGANEGAKSVPVEINNNNNQIILKQFIFVTFIIVFFNLFNFCFSL
ncbi:Conserved_hypothetical protein [Hexamita inflata]|uniref:Uncharacterized protein n=1 Tax=Hexamita inflata TaxID=28002 RepID=A0AA86TF97_9EUKA|nr:Conserved hypothetical protein [Hexamita inflata]